MSEPYLSELRLFSFQFAPKGWALCNGQTLTINQNQALFALLGTTYGGDGIRTFQLPNLQGNTALSFGNGFTQGQAGGEATHTLAASQMPVHNHSLNAYAGTPDAGAAGETPAATKSLAEPVALTGSTVSIYATGTPGITMAQNAVAPTGGAQPHPNQQPYLVLNWCIALQGIFPSRN